MITYLRVKNFQLIEDIEIEVSAGLTVLTGETGAGKSMLVEALMFALGGRARSEWVGAWGDEATVELQWQSTNDPDPQVLVRRCHRDGRSVIKLSDALVTLSELENRFQDLALRQRQGQTWLLKKSHYPRQVLDDYGREDIQPMKIKFSAAHTQWQACQAARTQLDTRLKQLEKDADYITHQHAELSKLETGEIDEDVLQTRRQRLANQVRITERLSQALEALDGVEERWHNLAGVLDKLQADWSDPALFEEALRGVEAYVQDVRTKLGTLPEDMADPRALDEVEERLALLRLLKRKYGDDLSQAIAQAQRDMQDLQQGRMQLVELSTQAQTFERAMQAAGEQLSQQRCVWAQKLAGACQQQLKLLGFAYPQFKVQTELLPLPGPEGFDDIQFLFSANPDVAPLPMAQVASGGELSRVLLALYSVSAHKMAVPVLIFDEIDSGLGGQTANQVGALLRQLGSHGQVLAITHLAQVAATAHHHWHLEKQIKNKRSCLLVKIVSVNDRPKVLAELMGDQGTEAGLEHAELLLKKAGAKLKHERMK